MHFKYVLAFDPSGNYNEGKGTTGWCLLSTYPDKHIIAGGHISAACFKSMEAYWAEHIKLIDTYKQKYGTNLVLVIEDYLLYKHKAANQTNSRMETCKLIGVLQYYCYTSELLYIMQPAVEVKTRWTNDTLCYKNYIKKKRNKFIIPATNAEINKHCLDSIRHAVHFATFKNK